jgi:agmatine deiminase
MKLLGTTPAEDGFYMPAEFDAHEGCIMIWPERPGTWIYGAQDARKTFARLAGAISRSEHVIMLVNKTSEASAREMLPESVQIQLIDSDDAWARDTAPTFVKNRQGLVRSVNWRFNAWGGAFDGLYASWENDDRLAAAFCELNGYDYYDAHPVVLEGGAIHTDGEGTVLVTEACLLSPGRNPQFGKAEIEARLKAYLGAEKIVWLPHGVYNDETHEHGITSGVCPPGEVVLAWTYNQQDPQYAIQRAVLTRFARRPMRKGRRLTVHKLPIPDFSRMHHAGGAHGYAFEAGEHERAAGERLAASYVNFYFSNGAVILPQFGTENTRSDERAVRIMARLCPQREIIPIPARDIIIGGGNIHCITQQIPKGVKRI